ncbi:peptidoglycan-binding protein [Paracoccus laeviglucosivorans]|uniref:Peptidoglycan binding domain-containing protein n=1 Tax=Paracoccus laeviglucosivorans TaxID=1197861 RepID=A0A521FR94_9RHOB|nr:peptidoglycan-binding protein [Paracoccus laeviglucosivorans]SMO98652.1 Putative peptidoglycan binding domain-containing protein [Paracoccus laeviglucosivorans]
MRFSLLLLAALFAAGAASAENRALVVGNADYANAPDLAGADTEKLMQAMQDAGFTTASGINQNTEDMRRTMDLLARTDDAPGVRIVWLSGRFVSGAGDTWFLGTDADRPDPFGAGSQGIPLSLILQLMTDAQPGAVLLLGTDAQTMPHQPGLESGIGDIAAIKGVSVITGSPETTALALRELGAGRSVAQAVAADPDLRLLTGGNGALIPVPTKAPVKPAPPAPNPAEADRTAWAEAARGDTPESYLRYLQRYPSGLYSEAARERRQQLQDRNAAIMADRNAWANAAASNRAAAYEGYLQRFPNGEYAASAHKRLAELRQANRPTPPKPPVLPPKPETPQQIESALKLDRAARQSVQRGLSRLGYTPGEPDGDFGARTRAALKVWQGNHRFVSNGYLNLSQLRALQNEIAYLDGDNGNRDRDYWVKTGAHGDAAGLRAYLQRYPNGRYAAEARRQLTAPPVSPPILDPIARGDAATWRWARRQDTAAAYNTYLERYPRGNHAIEARQRRDSLQAGTEAARREEAALNLELPVRRLIEERLARANMSPGPVDGRFTEETRQALRRYQAAHNLRVTGYVSQQTVSSLLSDVLLRPR